jgi:hypothetical protein
MLGLGTQHGAGLVADDGEVVPVGDECAQHRLATGERGQPLDMDRAETVHVYLPRLLPALTKDRRKGVA